MAEILAVDDDPDNLELLNQILEDDFDVITARSGVECLQRAGHDHPDVILLDVQMPEMDGYEVFQKLQEHERTRTIPVIFVTARYRDPDRVIRGLELGAFDYITKPINDDVLLAKVAMAARVKRAEDALQEAKDYTEGIIQSMADMLVVVSPDGRIVTVNQAACTVLGYPEDELIGQPAAMLLEEEDTARLILSEDVLPFKRTVLDRLVKEGSVNNIEKSLLTKAGDKIPVLISGSIMRDDHGEIRGIVCLAWDITERKRAEEQIEDLARFPAENPSPVLRTNADGTLLSANDAAEDLLDSFACQIGQTLPADWQQLTAVAVKSKSRKQIDIEHNGTVISFVLVPVEGKEYVNWYGRDVTDRRKAEEALQQLNQELESKVAERTKTLRESWDFIQTISDAATYFLWVYDLSEDHFLHMNKSLVQFLDLPPDTGFPLPGKMAEKLIHPDDVPAHAAYRERSRKADDGERLDRELRVKNGAGQWQWFLARSTVLNRNPDGSPRQLLGTAIDVTERKQAEAKLQQQAEDIARYSRITTAGEMASAMAHELNQPLHAISLHSEVCTELLAGAEGGGAVEELHDSLREITEQAQRAGQIVNFLRNYVRDAEPHRSTHDLNEIVRDIRTILTSEIERRGVRVVFESVADRQLVCVDRIQIEQVLVNLVRNAIEAVEENVWSDRDLRITASFGLDDEAQVAVCDNGKGIPDSELAKVFDGYYTTKADGMGLGLTICKNIIKAHGGSLTVRRNSDRGVTFTFTLPRLAPTERTD